MLARYVLVTKGYSNCKVADLAEGLGNLGQVNCSSKDMIVSKLNRYTKEARQALSNAREEALRLKHRIVGPEHILLGILQMNDPIIECIFSKLQVSSTRLRQALEFVVGHGNKALISEPTLSPTARAALVRAEQESVDMGEELIGVEHLLLGLLKNKEGIAVGVLESFGLYL